MAKSTKQTLTDARNLLATKGWTTNALAADAEKGEVSPLSPNATCYCMLGAIYAAIYYDPDITGYVAEKSSESCKAETLLDQTLRTYFEFGEGVVEFNDAKASTVDDVLDVFDRAIALAND